MNKSELSIIQRIIAVFVYIGIFLISCYWFSGQNWGFLTDSKSNYNILFVSGALLLVFGSYVSEPFFTKPVDVLTNSTAVILALLSINKPADFIGYHLLFFSACFLLISSVVVIFLSHFKIAEKFQKVFFLLLTKAGQSKIVFSFIYIFTIFSYFERSPIVFSFFVTFWAIIVTQFLIENILLFASNIIDYIFHYRKHLEVIGQAIGCENPFLYKVEVDFAKHKIMELKKGELVYLSLDKGLGAVGVVINEKQLLNKKWLTIYLLDHENAPLKVNLKTRTFIAGTNTIFSRDNAVCLFDIKNLEDNTAKELIESNYFYRNKDNFVGYITDGSDINKIRFLALIDSSNVKYQSLKEGSVIKTKIYEQETLFQIIDGKTNEEELEKHSSYGYLIGIAQKLGKYDLAKQELETVRWLPNIYSPVFLDQTKCETKNPLSIGKLPTTDLQIILKDLDSLVTHNTAVLGILGIGKSCLTFELIQKTISNTDAKIICIDITNEYKKELSKYVEKSLIQEEITQNSLNELKSNNKDGNCDNPNTWGNEALYCTKISEELKAYFESNKKILLLNPDWHSVSKAGSKYKIQHKVDLTVSEKTRIVAERIFIHAKNQGDLLADEERNKNKARYLVVFEEAHSLIPEWNSVANEGDQNASNGTAKVILQGRKYGLGSIITTQRTANISKSILNQCNTIFALRIFDDTGKQFLENYIGSDYSNTLPKLEERHAIVVGKALKLKQPVIVELNDRQQLLIQHKNQDEQ